MPRRAASAPLPPLPVQPLSTRAKIHGDVESLLAGGHVAYLGSPRGRRRHRPRCAAAPGGRRAGLDPNVWFRNGEYVAAEKIGAETVTYVSNIYKHRIAYRLILEAREAREARKTARESALDASRDKKK